LSHSVKGIRKDYQKKKKARKIPNLRGYSASSMRQTLSTTKTEEEPRGRKLGKSTTYLANHSNCQGGRMKTIGRQMEKEKTNVREMD